LGEEGLELVRGGDLVGVWGWRGGHDGFWGALKSPEEVSGSGEGSEQATFLVSLAIRVARVINPWINQFTL
jgi:hypothetical protein